MPFNVLVVTQAMVVLAFVMLLAFHSKVKLTFDPFATNELDFLQVTQINQQVPPPRHITSAATIPLPDHQPPSQHATHACTPPA